MSAARVYDVPVPQFADEHLSVFSEKERRRRNGVQSHVTPKSTAVGRLRGVRVSMPVQMFIVLASMPSLVDLVIVGDALVRRRLVTREELVEACRESSCRHAPAALRAAEYVRAGVDSPMETRLRMLIVLAGLPEPEVNYKVLDSRGRVLRRFDLSYPQLKLIVEYDGRQHAEDPGQYDSDIYRREDLDRWGWRIIVVTAKGSSSAPRRPCAGSVSALREHGARGLPVRFAEEWRVHFPVQMPVRRSS